MSDETRKAIFQAAENLNYRKKIVYPKIEHVALLFWSSGQEELEDIYYRSICDEMQRQAEIRNVELTLVLKKEGVEAVPKDTRAFLGIGWFSQKEIDTLRKITEQGIFVDTSPDEIKMKTILRHRYRHAMRKEKDMGFQLL